jgi:hypothetical protein
MFLFVPTLAASFKFSLVKINHKSFYHQIREYKKQFYGIPRFNQQQ